VTAADLLAARTDYADCQRLVWHLLTDPRTPRGLLEAGLTRLDRARRREMAARVARLREVRA
jgi:hypothetical protein